MERMVTVYDVDNDETLEVTAAEAAAGMIRYAREHLGAGTPACAVWEQRAPQRSPGPVPGRPGRGGQARSR